MEEKVNLAKISIGLEYWDVALQYAQCAEEDYMRINNQNRLVESRKIIEEIKEKIQK